MLLTTITNQFSRTDNSQTCPQAVYDYPYLYNGYSISKDILPRFENAKRNDDRVESMSWTKTIEIKDKFFYE